jgi:hypothetical protein
LGGSAEGAEDESREAITPVIAKLIIRGLPLSLYCQSLIERNPLSGG